MTLSRCYYAQGDALPPFTTPEQVTITLSYRTYLLLSNRKDAKPLNIIFLQTPGVPKAAINRKTKYLAETW